MRVEAHVHIGRARRGIGECISVRPLPGGRVEYDSYLHLRNVKFAVQPAGLKKFREQGVKNVHAFVRGDKVVSFTGSNGGARSAAIQSGFREAGYNPRVNDTFIGADGEPLFTASEVVLIGKQLFYK